MRRALLFLGAALVVLTLGAPQARAQFFDRCCQWGNTQCVTCSVPPCDEAICWKTCRSTTRGHAGTFVILYCCDQVAVQTLYYEGTCSTARPPEMAVAGGSHARAFYVRGCDGDYALIDPSQKS